MHKRFLGDFSQTHCELTDWRIEKSIKLESGINSEVEKLKLAFGIVSECDDILVYNFEFRFAWQEAEKPIWILKLFWLFELSGPLGTIT